VKRDPLSRLGRFWYLVGHTPVGTDDVAVWSDNLEPIEARRVGNTQIGVVSVSTVFLGVDHQFWGGPPLLFETMIFGGPQDEFCERYSTWDEAEAGHARIVAALRAGEVVA